MRGCNKQVELLSEMLTPYKALNYAVNRERRHAKQQEILRANSTNWNTTGHTKEPNTKLQTPQTRKVRHIKQEVTESDQTDESVDAEAALYIKELFAQLILSQRKTTAATKSQTENFGVGTTTRA